MDIYTKILCALLVVGFVVGIIYAQVNGFTIQ